ncbi:MAG: LLM class flavin-dependent oxidoreductase [Candidatus Tectomicrobia bacterium]
MPKRRVLPKSYQQPHPRMSLACTSQDSFRLAAQKGIGVLSSISYAVNVLADLVKVYRDVLKNAEPVGELITDFWDYNVHAFCNDDDQCAKDLAARSMKTFFGPDKPYIQGCINAYEELLEVWGGIRDYLQADFGRWLRQSDDEHKKLAEEAGISLDSGPGAARAAFAQLDSATLSDRGVSIAGNPASCIKTCQMYEDIGVDQVMLIMQTEPIPHDKVMGSIEKACGSRSCSP